jgi:hypothetical protein
MKLSRSNSAPDELIEDHVANDQDAGLARGNQDLPRSRGR